MLEPKLLIGRNVNVCNIPSSGSCCSGGSLHSNNTDRLVNNKINIYIFAVNKETYFAYLRAVVARLR